jgi:hypothetical protein
MNSGCTNIEVAPSFEDPLKNVLAKHLLDRLRSFVETFRAASKSYKIQSLGEYKYKSVSKIKWRI